MKFLTISIFALTMSLTAFAKETKICTIVSDIDNEQTAMIIETKSNGDLDSIRLYKTLGNSVVYDATHPVEVVIRDGIVAAEREGRDAVILKANQFHVSRGGIITIDYLYNAIRNERKTYNLKLTRVGQNYVLSTVEGAAVNFIKFFGNKVLGRVVGIKAVQVGFSRR